MKILDVCEFYSERGGGVRTYVHRKLSAARKLGVEVVIVAPGAKNAEQYADGGRIVWIESPVMPLDARYHVLCNERAVHTRIASEGPDLIEGSSSWGGGWMVARYPHETPRALVFHQDPVAVYSHTLLDRWVSRGTLDRTCEPYWAYLRRLSARFDTTIVAAQWLADRLCTQGMAEVQAVPFGIDKAAFRPEHASEAVRKAWLAKAGAPRDAYLLLSISRHHPEKRLGTVLSAVDRLHRSRELDRPVALVVFGDGMLRGWLERRARQVPYVHLAGFTDDMDELAQVLASADAFVHGSAAETYGLVIAEALCSGLPLVVPNVGGASELARDSYAERYRPGDSHDCAAATLRLLRRIESARAAATKLGREEVVVDADTHFERLFALYARLARTPARRVA